jgi:hypothetical protein
MRIQGPGGTAIVSGGLPAKRTAAGSFTLTASESAHAGTSAVALRTVGGIDALIALQGIEDASERRRHAVKRGQLALDALDELKIGLLGGDFSSVSLTRLRAAASHLKDGSGDPNLDRVLAEIELRVEVELAKMAAG